MNSKLVFLFILLCPSISWAFGCTCSADIKTDLVSLPEPAGYYGHYIIGEMERIYIKNIVVSNTGNCTMYNTSPSIALVRPSGSEASFRISTIPILAPGETYIYETREVGDLDVVTGPIVAYEIGLYRINYNMQIGSCYSNNNSWNMHVTNKLITLNGDLIDLSGSAYFSVKSITELALLKNAEETLNETKRSADASQESAGWAFWAVIIALVLGGVNIIINAMSSKSQMKSLRKVARNIRDAAEFQAEVINDQEERARLDYLEACVNELNHDLQIAEMIRTVCDSKELGKEVNLQKFSYFCIEEFLSHNILEEVPTDIPEKLFMIRHVLVLINDSLDKTFYAPSDPVRAKLWKVISNTLSKSNIEIMREVTDKLEKLLDDAKANE